MAARWVIGAFVVVAVLGGVDQYREHQQRAVIGDIWGQLAALEDENAELRAALADVTTADAEAVDDAVTGFDASLDAVADDVDELEEELEVVGDVVAALDERGAVVQEEISDPAIGGMFGSRLDDLDIRLADLNQCLNSISAALSSATRFVGC